MYKDQAKADMLLRWKGVRFVAPSFSSAAAQSAVCFIGKLDAELKAIKINSKGEARAKFPDGIV